MVLTFGPPEIERGPNRFPHEMNHVGLVCEAAFVVLIGRLPQ